ncbi:UDP-N-acetylmuramoyl-L-alanine--D-glutamate ligase [Salinibacter ruber]|uniref:UDP-N-acetylmuramoylalanine--D-glutamate ligase n=1 Tax=Salinibacter ruber TaxID=146919 RepID=A0A9X2ZC02_9BACT|nr:UDP-N-acetylmuramoyl-L-alanine--D-glutamate ligase [Salinibacter ruber]MBB4091033.1 UDP-N-acetylmuramoylalanine--D-glutamate ligase [Salinibacter ruber]MCS3613062.1 UDP-N-acetylmuramoylalanine--D-glutamate ligase [Salinibacter ruber]MCS3616282.1 UDP-N-acetylmuramoylalanine--D-glutamate ligase [Salinibacter ruber]MCS3647566.1 UDP-N-acetylmuramoylalanine--D-glutamate ligase [Salinibacter ruber]MCS3675588.1 UDP-N-acetylmuramoylalanine--D-glutamate ligase [Salinibacter ruber]
MTPDEVRRTRATVVGGARSGRAAARLLAKVGGEVFLTEQDAPSDGAAAALDEAGVEYEFGGHTAEALDADVLVLSPGVPTQSNIVQQALRAGLDVYSEIEAASWFCDAPIVAITGTNGKTTTTSLTGHVFRTAFADTPGREAIVAGNIGYPFSDYVLETEPTDVVVLEVSSFQLDHVETFRPRVSVLLNITPDHLGRYDHDFEAYAQAKHNIFRNQGEGDVVVYNRDDDDVRDAVEEAAAEQGVRPMAITREGVPAAGAGFRGGRIVLRTDDEDDSLMPQDELALRGRHNMYNSLAAAVSARVMEVENDVIRESLSGFEGVPHRLEEVRTVEGVLYVNDSKATNVNAVWYALESFDRPIVLIAGGRDKGNDYTDLKPLVRDQVRAVVALGESAEKVERELGGEAPDHSRAETMEDALTQAQRAAQPGDVVLLSPACSSFDMYENYEERGDTFRRLAETLL